MSDILTKELAKLKERVEQSELNDVATHEVKRRIIDSIACLFAGYHEEVSTYARNLSKVYPYSGGATVIGTSHKTTSDIAGFANGTAIRSLDFNDTYLSVEPLHPSDVIAPLLALAEEESIAPTRLLTSIALAYEIGVLFCDSASLKANGWDHVNYITLATTLGGAHLLGLNSEQTEHALALAIVPHAAMRQTRNGEISMWKGAAAANAARNAIFALKLAKGGMKGPYEPFIGSMGFVKQLLNNTLDVQKIVEMIRSTESLSRITMTYIKNWAVEYMTQAAIEAALELKKEINSLNEVDQIEIQTFQLAYDVLAKDEQKWDPKTRETADHSLPFIVAAALEDGKIDLNTFHQERIRNKETLKRMKEQVMVKVNDELTAEYPDGNPTILILRLKNGQELKTKVKYPIGHVGKPMTDEQLNQKFLSITKDVLLPSQQENILNLLWKFDQLSNYSDLMKLFVIES